MRSSTDIWSHYGADALGDGKSELEIFQRVMNDLMAGREVDLEKVGTALAGLAHSYGWAESDSHRNEMADRDVGASDADYYEALDEQFANLWEGDYETCIDAQERALQVLTGGRTVGDTLCQRMRDAYKAGRDAEMAEYEEPAVGPKP